VGTLSAVNFSGGEVDTLNGKDFAGAGKNRIPCYFEMSAFQAVGGARWNFRLVKMIAHFFTIIEIMLTGKKKLKRFLPDRSLHQSAKSLYR